MRVSWTPRAILDTGHIWRYIARDNPVAAMDVVDAIFNSASLLAQQPYLGRAGKRARSLGVGQYPYIIRYRVRRDEIEILSIWHDRQERPR